MTSRPPITELVAAVREHLAAFAVPDPVAVELATVGDPLRVQLRSADLAGICSDLLTWADTLDRISAQVWRLDEGRTLHIALHGRLAGGVPIVVYGMCLHCPAVFPTLDAGQRRPLSLAVVRACAEPPTAPGALESGWPA